MGGGSILKSATSVTTFNDTPVSHLNRNWFNESEDEEKRMDSKVVFKKTARLAVTAGLAASMTLGSFPVAVFADAAAEPAPKPAAEQEAPKADATSVEEQEAPKAGEKASETVVQPATEQPEAAEATTQKDVDDANGSLQLHGTITKDLTISKKLDITAAPGTVVKSTISFVSGSSNSSIMGAKFVINGAKGNPSTHNPSIHIKDGVDGIVLSNNTFEIGYYAQKDQINAVRVESGAENTSLTGNHFNITISGYAGKTNAGINLVGGSDPIKNTTISGNDFTSELFTGDAVGQNADATLLVCNGNTASGSYGIQGVTFTGNKVINGTGEPADRSQTRGISVAGTKDLKVTGNNVFTGTYMAVSHSTWSDGKVEQSKNTGLVVEGNTIKDGYIGVYMKPDYVADGGMQVANNTVSGTGTLFYEKEDDGQTAPVVQGAEGKMYFSVKAALDAGEQKVTLLQPTNENVTVTKPGVTISTAEGVTYKGNLTVSADNVVLDGFNAAITKETTGNNSVDIINDSKNVVIKNSHFAIDADASDQKQLNSIFAASSDGLTVDGNTFELAPRDPKAAGSENNDRVAVNLTSGSKNVTVKNNTMNGVPSENPNFKQGAFVMAFMTDGLTVSNNTIGKADGSDAGLNPATKGLRGVILGTVSGEVKIQENHFNSGMYGVNVYDYDKDDELLNTAKLTIADNSFNGAKGIYITEGSIDPKVEKPVVSGNTFGEGTENLDPDGLVVEPKLAFGNAVSEGVWKYDIAKDADGVSEEELLSLVKPLGNNSYKVTVDTKNLAALNKAIGAKKVGATFEFAYSVEKADTSDKVGLPTLKLTVMLTDSTPAPEPAEKFTVTFVDNFNKTFDKVAVEKGEAVAKPTDPSFDGWKFEGWFTDAAAKNAYDFSAPVTGDLTLYAGYSKFGVPTETEPEQTEAQKPAEKVALPKTGDDSALPMAVAAGAGVVAVATGAVAFKRRKQE